MNLLRVFGSMLLDGRINGSCCCKWFAKPTLGNLGNFGNFGNLKSEMFSFWDNAVTSCAVLWFVAIYKFLVIMLR